MGPKFFNLAIDKLIARKILFRLFCRQLFCWCFSNVDDIISLSGSLRQLHLMLDLCINFGCDLVFNVKQSYCGLVGVLTGDVFYNLK